MLFNGQTTGIMWFGHFVSYTLVFYLNAGRKLKILQPLEKMRKQLVWQHLTSNSWDFKGSVLLLVLLPIHTSIYIITTKSMNVKGDYARRNVRSWIRIITLPNEKVEEQSRQRIWDLGIGILHSKCWVKLKCIQHPQNSSV
jgi:hypothetical protein